MNILCTGRRISLEFSAEELRPLDSTVFSTPPIISTPTSASVVLSHTGSFSMVFAKLTRPPCTPASSSSLSKSPEALIIPTSVISAPRTTITILSASPAPVLFFFVMRISSL